jgi:cystathionine gamma-lyase
MKKGSISVDFVDLTDFEALEKSRKPETKLLIVETPTNPTMKICDIEKLCSWAKKHKVLSLVDNTFASPYLQSPLLLGADICLNSCTKYIGGHCDVVMGTLTLNDQELRDKLYFVQKSFGGVPSPFESYLALRGLKTLKLRMEEHCKNAQILAEYLDKHPKIAKVCYPGLKHHPHYEVARKQMRGFGGMISIYLKGDLAAVKKLCSSLKLFYCAESLGGVESLIQVPAIMTHASVPLEVRKKLGIEDNLVRISVGIESVEDLLKDLDQALALI